MKKSTIINLLGVFLAILFISQVSHSRLYPGYYVFPTQGIHDSLSLKVYFQHKTPEMSDKSISTSTRKGMYAMFFDSRVLFNEFPSQTPASHNCFYLTLPQRSLPVMNIDAARTENQPVYLHNARTQKTIGLYWPEKFYDVELAVPESPPQHYLIGVRDTPYVRDLPCFQVHMHSSAHLRQLKVSPLTATLTTTSIAVCINLQGKVIIADSHAPPEGYAVVITLSAPDAPVIYFELIKWALNDICNLWIALYKVATQSEYESVNAVKAEKDLQNLMLEIAKDSFHQKVFTIWERVESAVCSMYKDLELTAPQREFLKPYSHVAYALNYTTDSAPILASFSEIPPPIPAKSKIAPSASAQQVKQGKDQNLPPNYVKLASPTRTTTACPMPCETKQVNFAKLEHILFMARADVLVYQQSDAKDQSKNQMWGILEGLCSAFRGVRGDFCEQTYFQQVLTSYNDARNSWHGTAAGFDRPRLPEYQDNQTATTGHFIPIPKAVVSSQNFGFLPKSKDSGYPQTPPTPAPMLSASSCDSTQRVMTPVFLTPHDQEDEWVPDMDLDPSGSHKPAFIPAPSRLSTLKNDVKTAFENAQTACKDTKQRSRGGKIKLECENKLHFLHLSVDALREEAVEIKTLERYTKELDGLLEVWEKASTQVILPRTKDTHAR